MKKNKWTAKQLKAAQKYAIELVDADSPVIRPICKDIYYGDDMPRHVKIDRVVQYLLLRADELLAFADAK
jgi:hypothetical protein